jgi:formate dehydrogenase assembly factor FdhD
MARIVRVDGDTSTELEDAIVVEEPLEIRVDDKPVSVTLRTPGDDFDLAAGFLFTESILKRADDARRIGTGARRTSCASGCAKACASTCSGCSGTSTRRRRGVWKTSIEAARADDADRAGSWSSRAT